MRLITLPLIVSCLYLTEFVALNITVPTIQNLEIINSIELPDIFSDDINRGYIDINDAVSLQVKSNVAWKLSIRTKKNSLYLHKDIDVSNILVNLDGVSTNLSSDPIVIASGRQTSGSIINISYRRNLSWDTCPPGAWRIEPEFKLEPLQ